MWFRSIVKAIPAGVVVVGMTCASEQSLLAQAPDSGDRDRALELFREARRLQDQGRQAEACELFRRSAELRRGPGILLNLAQCFEREGDPVKALETYQSALMGAEQHPAATTEQRAAWADEARRGINTQRRQVAEIVMNVHPTPGLELALDGAPIEARPQSFYVRPGSYRLTATARDRVSHTDDFTASAGASTSIQVPELERTETIADVKREPDVEPPMMAPEEPRREHTSYFPWILLGAGAASVSAGIVTGIVTASKARELEEECPGGSCPAETREPGWQDKIDSSQRLALVTNVLWGVGLATAGIGVTLLILDGGDENEEAAMQAGCADRLCGLFMHGAF